MAELKTLQLGDATVFDNTPLPTAWYDVVITKVEDCEVENDTGKLPVGTPGVVVTFRVDGGEHDGRLQWNRYWFAPADYNPKSKGFMDGAWLSLFEACGFGTQDDLRKGKGVPKSTDELISQELSIRVGTQKNDPERNEIKAVRKRGQAAEAGGLL